MKNKVTVIGAGNVGASCAQILAYKQVASEIVLLDIVDGYAEGKAMDIMQCATSFGFDSVVKGVTNDYAATKDSDVVVITSGLPRKPGMTREELVATNVAIAKTVTENILAYSPNTIILVVTNPLDTITYAVWKASGLPKHRVIGMGGGLDSARFKYFISQQLNVPQNELEAMVIGGHGDTTMIPLIRMAHYKGLPLHQLMDEATQEAVVKQTMVGGATLTKLLGTSAWYGPAAAVVGFVDAVLHNRKKMIACATILDGEYGAKDVAIGVPCIVGSNGVEQIVQLDLTDKEQALFDASVSAIKAVNAEVNF